MYTNSNKTHNTKNPHMDRTTHNSHPQFGNMSADLVGVNICDHSSWASVEKIRATSEEQVEPVLDRLFGTFGAPEVYKTDNSEHSEHSEFLAFRAWYRKRQNNGKSGA